MSLHSQLQEGRKHLSRLAGSLLERLRPASDATPEHARSSTIHTSGRNPPASTSAITSILSDFAF